MSRRGEAPSFAALKPAQKALVRKIGNTPDHAIEAVDGTPGKGWLSLEDSGWVRVREHHYGGYRVAFTLNGWERWCQQVDVENGDEPQELEFE